MSGGARTQTPTFINLPPPPADPTTPSDAPGTPNSATTSMSELSTVAIKDGHRGHLPHNHHHNPMDAERADRISRLAGLERVGQPGRNLGTPNSQAGSAYTGGPAQHPLAHAYFDGNNAPQITRERSTVGSASATGSVGGRTTWASGSDMYDQDKMSVSEDMDVDNSSVGGFSNDEASLVGFGEGARTPARQLSAVGSPTPSSKVGPLAGVGASAAATTPTRSQGAMTPMSAIEAQKMDAKMIDGVAYDPNVLDTTNRTPPPAED